MSYAYAQPHNNKLDELSGAEYLENGTVGSTGSMVYIRTPAAQRLALDIYSKAEILENTVQKGGSAMTGDLDMAGNTIANLPTAQNPGRR